MKKHFITLGLLSVSTLAFGQHKKIDTLKVQQIEDVNLHKTGNPNKAKALTTKTNLSVMDTPQPIAIVTHEIIEQQQAKQLSEVLQNVNGLYVTSARGGSQDSFGGRGFNFGNDNIFKNGSRVNSGAFPEVSGLERVEVLKGANAMLYGNVAPGGIVNMITKKPRFNFGGSIGMNVGSWNNYKPTVDLYGPLSDKVAYRVNGTYEYADSFRDVVNNQKYYFNPSFLFNIGSKTQLIVEADYLKNNFTPDFGLGSITDKKDGSYKINDLVPISTFFGADWQFQNVQQTTSTITLNTEVAENWLLNAVASYQNYVKDYFSTERIQWSYDSNIPNDRIKWDRPLNRTYNENNYASLQFNLNGSFKTGDVVHKILIGTDGDYQNVDSYTYDNPKKYGTNGSITNATIYLDDPSTWTSGAEIKGLNTIGKVRIPTQRFGFYAQDFIELSKEFKVLAGLRWSYLENKSSIKTDFKTGNTTETAGTVDRAFSPKAGLVYTPNKHLTIFGTYTNSFSPNSGRTIYDEALKPSIIDQFEIGMKKDFWDNAVALNLSLYQITNRNAYQTAEFDKNGNPNSDRYVREFAGKMRSRGVELDITGNPMPNLSLIGGFSYNHSVYTETPDDFGYVENQRLVRTPATTANASVFYTFTKGIKGLKLGATLYYIGDRIAGWNDTKKTLKDRNNVSRLMELDDYTTVALSAGYSWDKFSIQAKVGNLFNTKNYVVHENYSVNPLTPRNFYVTVNYKL
ncbi:TonB-dependent siderophore receptor [Riemerella columbina]|uniref:TonB-dependent siderophore receptor n=1 Tax=Riemerella columbina TaxID=103810 RepID=UPI002670882C|nr:TonB-dependent receptor [Riemerella columbina]WKS95973.1 TonB-dependent receptor [Riemerella columbina]